MTTQTRTARILLYGPLLFVFGLALVHAAAVCSDYLAAIASPLEIDYGEGIVWQQAVLIPGPHMYSRSQALPFIVFHYPPLYHLLTRAMSHVMPSFLAAGRCVSAIASLVIAACAAALVLTARRHDTRAALTDLLAAGIAGMLLLCLHVVHVWGMVMRVDAAAIAFALAGLLVGARGNGKLWSTVVGLALCLCAAYTKQTQISAGIALFLVTLWRAPRIACIAATFVGSAGLAILGLLQWLTQGGFLLNIVGYNINRFSLGAFRNTLLLERSSIFVAVAILVAAALLAPGARKNLKLGSEGKIDCRPLLLLYLGLTTLTLLAAFKSGGSFGYFFEWMAAGCTVFGIALADLAASARVRGSAAGPMVMLAPILFTLLLLPMHVLDFLNDPSNLAVRTALVTRIAATEKPVASDNMTVLMQAGHNVVYEPAIVTELASIGRWNEAPLLDMIYAHEFAFIIATNTPQIEATRRTPAVRAAIAQAYPRVETLAPGLRLYLP